MAVGVLLHSIPQGRLDTSMSRRMMQNWRGGLVVLAIGAAAATTSVVACKVLTPVLRREWFAPASAQLGWPSATLMLVAALYPLLLLLVGVLALKVWKSGKITWAWGESRGELGFQTTKLPRPAADQQITARHLALKAVSWRGYRSAVWRLGQEVSTARLSLRRNCPRPLKCSTVSRT